MSTVSQIAKYLTELTEFGYGDFNLKVGTRGVESLRPGGIPMNLVIPSFDDGIDSGKKCVFLRADNGG